MPNPPTSSCVRFDEHLREQTVDDRDRLVLEHVCDELDIDERDALVDIDHHDVDLDAAAAAGHPGRLVGALRRARRRAAHRPRRPGGVRRRLRRRAPVHAAGFGTRTPDDPADVVTTTDRFRIASISKVITATVVLQLVDAGFLQLDEPVGLRLAGIAGVAPGDGVAAVTVRQLLSHTSGFPDYRDQFFGDQFTSCEQAAAFGLGRSLARTPGTRHDYSNLNFCLLGLLVADVTGRPYEQAVSELLLQPLGITGMRLVATIDPSA